MKETQTIEKKETKKETFTRYIDYIIIWLHILTISTLILLRISYITLFIHSNNPPCKYSSVL